jgi:hypothetical protein
MYEHRARPPRTSPGQAPDLPLFVTNVTV